MDLLRQLVVGTNGQLLFPNTLPARIAFRGAARQLCWSTVALDLVEVATSVLFADRLVRRTRAGGRSITLNLAVRHPKTWRDVEPLLHNVLADLTGDEFEFIFRRGDSRQFLLRRPVTPDPPLLLDRVSLFSGGLDSSAGAAHLASLAGRSGFVTQYSSGIKHREDLLSDILGQFGTNSHLAPASYFIQPAGALAHKMRENSRRSRSFLFVSLALATAHGSSAQQVFVCENGPLALNLPLSPAMVPTRHAHGQFLFGMERLARRLFGTPIQVVNPFELTTKGEMTRIFQSHPDLALRTKSCWYQQWSGKGNNYGIGHCGHCLPCVVRRASLHAAGIEIPRSHFDLDVNSLNSRGRLSDRQLRLVEPLRLLLGFVDRVSRERSWKDFVRAFPEVVYQNPTQNRGIKTEPWLRELHRTMKRFALEVEECYGGVN